MENSKHAVLILEDGTTLYGKAIGKVGTAIGEVTYNTVMSGYQEIVTDPSSFGQLIVMTNPHIGNYGADAIDTEFHSATAAGMITKDFSDYFSRSSASESMQEYMETQGMVGISDVDTRMLTAHIRDNGTMKGIISSEDISVEDLKKQLAQATLATNVANQISTKEAYELEPDNAVYKVAVVDFGIKKGLLNLLLEKGCHIKVFPMNTPLATMEAFSPQGYVLSNGPGNPAEMTESVALVKEIVAAGKPVFGVDLGHLLLGLSQGAASEKMFVGHRGANHPIKNLISGKGEITAQNHGYVLTKESVDATTSLSVTHIHLNDQSVAGIQVEGKPAFSVQYYPESKDSHYLVETFINNVKSH